MFTSFFEKSKPINFLLVGLGMAIYYCVVNFVFISTAITVSYVFEKLGFLAVYLILMVLVDFVVKRNRINRRNTYAILLFALFTAWFPDILRNGKILLSGFFFLLALRRIISLKSGMDTKKKIFDAAFWIAMSSLFFEWSLLFLMLVFLAILFYAANDYRNWLVPFVAMAAVFILATCFSIATAGSFFGLDYFFSQPKWDFELYISWPKILPLSIFCLFSIWAFVHYLFLLKSASSTMKSSMILIVGIWMLAVFVVLCSHAGREGELLFFIVPNVVIGANYFQAEGKKRFKNLLLLFLLLLTFSSLFFR